MFKQQIILNLKLSKLQFAKARKYGDFNKDVGLKFHIRKRHTQSLEFIIERIYL